MRALAALYEFVNDMPNFETLVYQEVSPEPSEPGGSYIQYTLGEDPLIQVRVTMSEVYKVDFVYLEQGTGCILNVTKYDWAQWLIDHLAESEAN